MRDNRGVNRMVEVLNSGIETGNSSNLIPKSSLSVDASVLKERNTNDSVSDSTKPHTNDTAKESKPNDSRESKLNAQCASDSNVRHSTSQRNSNNLMMSLDLDEIDYDDDDDEKCAKALTSEGENDSQNTLMDVDEPNENLYVTANKSKHIDREPKENANKKSVNDPVTIDSEEETNKRSEQEHESSIVVNGINKHNSSTNDVDKDNAKSADNTAKATTSKAMKRKVSISSDEDEQPPAKK